MEIATITSIWPIILSLIGFIVWLVRVEGRINFNDKEIARIEKKIDTLEIKHHNLDSRLVEQLAQVRESLARIEGALGVSGERT